MSKFKSSAQVVDGKLMLSFPRAVKPVVWQMDLNEVKSSALEVEGVKLIMKTADGAVSDVATFEDDKQSLAALMQISKALENARGKIALGAAANGNIQRSGGNVIGKILIFAVLAVLVFAGIVVLGKQTPTLKPISSMQSAAQTQVPAAHPSDAAGVPVDADAFLSGR